jgi:predicted transcriptional regulator
VSPFAAVTQLVLGELEKQVLLYFWRIKSADAKRVHAHFSKSRGGSLNTIQSTLDRLYKKELLTRHKEGHAYQYQAAVDRKEFIGSLIQEVADEYSKGDDDGMLAAFVSFSAELDSENLDRLEELIRRYRERTAAGDSE